MYVDNPRVDRRPRAGGRRATRSRFAWRCRSCQAFCVYEDESHERAKQADLRPAGRTAGGARAWVSGAIRTCGGGAGAGARFHGSALRSRGVRAIGSVGVEQGAVLQPGTGPHSSPESRAAPAAHWHLAVPSGDRGCRQVSAGSGDTARPGPRSKVFAAAKAPISAIMITVYYQDHRIRADIEQTLAGELGWRRPEKRRSSWSGARQTGAPPGT